MNKFFGLLFLSVAFSACYKDHEQVLYPNEYNFISDTVTFYWGRDIQPLINGKCATAGCHVPGATAPDLTTYAGVFASKDRVKVRAVDKKDMPGSGPLSATQITKLTHWLNAGAQQN